MTHQIPTLRFLQFRWTNVAALALAVMMLLGSNVGSVLAQPIATPTAGAKSPKLGDEVTYINENGGAIATLTVTNLVRPWTEFNDYYTPDSGSEYVAFEIEITHLGTRGDLIVKPDDFRLQDVDGFLLSRAWVTGADRATVMPSSDPVAIAPGKRGDVVVVYQVLSGVELDELVWQPAYDRLVTVVELGD